jgi:hypothetical protein
MTRTTVVLSLVVAVALGFAAPSALAARGQQTVFDATNDLLLAETVADRDAVLDQLDELGVDAIRIVVPWRSIVPAPDAAEMPAGFDPTDPAAYEGGVLNSIDESIRGAESRGMRVLLSPSAPIPDWASSSGASPVFGPEPAAFEKLMIGLGRRYDGSFGCGLPVCLPAPLVPLPGIPPLEPIPRVDFWSIWNEPNLDIFLRPQFRRGQSVVGALYRSLFLAGRSGLEASGHGNDTILIGETSPSSGRTSTAPLDFMRQVLCLDSRFRRRSACQPLEADGWAHHPYDQRGTPLRSSSNRVLGVPSLGKLIEALRRAARSGATKGRLPVFVTEYGVESVPDPSGVSLARQAEFIALSEFLLWRHPWVRSYGQYLLSDDRPGNVFAFQSGLRTHAGAAKPSYSAFPLALVVRRAGPRLRFWGHLRPGPGTVEVEARDRRGPPRVLRRIATDAGGYFAFSTGVGAAGQRWRARATLPGGRALSGPFVRAYAFR